MSLEIEDRTLVGDAACELRLGWKWCWQPWCSFVPRLPAEERERERGGVRSEGRGLGLRGDKASEREGDRFTWSGEIRTRGKISFAIPSLLCF